MARKDRLPRKLTQVLRVVVLGVNVADSRKIALDYLKENHVTFPIILDVSPAASKAINQYLALPDLGADPMTYVIGRDGKIVDGWFGYDPDRTTAAVKKVGF